MPLQYFELPTKFVLSVLLLCFVSIFNPSTYASAHAEAEAEADSFEFALIGDLPYGVGINEKNRDSRRLINSLNGEAKLSWVLHVGDIKRGSSSCSDEFLRDRYARFSQLTHPFILTPGDNEWTDCHNILAGGYDPFERLEFLRELFFESDDAKRTRTELNISVQPGIHEKHREYIENYYWTKHNVHFATIHIVGSKDGTKAIFRANKDIRKNQKKQTKDRQEAAISWLRWVIKSAIEKDASGLFIAIHGNPSWDLRWQEEDRPAYKYFIKELEKQLKKFDFPIVIAHGDTHTFRIDKPSPIYKKDAPSHFTRVETFGENNNAWIRIKVDPNSKSVFSYEIHDGQ